MAINSVAHAVRLVELLAEHPEGLGVSIIADRLGLPRPSVYRVLATLMDAEWCNRLGMSYRLSTRLLALAAGTTGVDSVMPEIQRLLTDLAAKTGETAHFAVLDGAGVTYVAKVDSSHPIRMFSRVGWRGPAHATGVGKALLAHAPEAVVQRVLSGKLHRYTDRSITTAAALTRELVRIRQRRYAVDREELIAGLVCIAVAVHDGTELLGAFSVAGPKDRMRDTTTIVTRLWEVAARLIERSQSRRST